MRKATTPIVQFNDSNSIRSAIDDIYKHINLLYDDVVNDPVVSVKNSKGKDHIVYNRKPHIDINTPSKDKFFGSITEKLSGHQGESPKFSGLSIDADGTVKGLIADKIKLTRPPVNNGELGWDSKGSKFLFKKSKDEELSFDGTSLASFKNITNGNPKLKAGSSSTEYFELQAHFKAGTKGMSDFRLRTVTASTDPDRGQITFYPDSVLHTALTDTQMILYNKALKIDASNDDYFSITTGPNAATVIKTDDYGGLGANLTLNIDGEILLNPITTIKATTNGGAYTATAANSLVTKSLVESYVNYPIHFGGYVTPNNTLKLYCQAYEESEQYLADLGTVGAAAGDTTAESYMGGYRGIIMPDSGTLHKFRVVADYVNTADSNIYTGEFVVLKGTPVDNSNSNITFTNCGVIAMGFDGEAENQISTLTFDSNYNSFNAGDVIVIGYRRTADDGDTIWTGGDTYYNAVKTYFSGVLTVNYDSI